MSSEGYETGEPQLATAT